MKLNPRKAVLIAGLLASGVAMAATETTTINVTATVTGSCSVSADPIAFGEVAADITTQMTATGAVTVNCTSGTNYLVGMDQGQHLLTGFRSMQNSAGNPISYVIQKPGGSSWGDAGIAGGNFTSATPVSGTGNGANQSLTFNASANGSGQQSSSNVFTAGTSYSDVVTVTVQF